MPNEYLEADMKKVISLREAEKPITKKEACKILKITYNTKRLDSLIESYKERKEQEKRLRKEYRGKPFTLPEKACIAKDYFNGDSIADISRRYYRSAQVIKRVILGLGIPLRSANHDYTNPPLLDEDSITTDYKEGDLVYSAVYSTPAIIRKLITVTDHNEHVYAIDLLGAYARNAYQPHYELSNLTHIQQQLGNIYD